MPGRKASINGRAAALGLSYMQTFTDLEFSDEIGIQGSLSFACREPLGRELGAEWPLGRTIDLVRKTVKIFDEPRLPSGGQA